MAADPPKLALALDVPSLAAAKRLAAPLADHFQMVKVGLELFTAAGPAAVAAMRDQGFEVFLDLKLHDIPNTVGGAARSAGRLGVHLLTIHAAGGESMLRAGVEGLREGSVEAGVEAHVLAITVLTSDPAPAAGAADPIVERLETALAAGAGGVVCSAVDLPTVRQRAASPRVTGAASGTEHRASVVLATGHSAEEAPASQPLTERAAEQQPQPTLLAVVPGIRPAGVSSNDQQRVGTPADAVRAGADVLVIGRAVTAAANPAAAAAAIVEEVRAAST